MLFLIALAAAFIFAYCCRKPFKQHPYFFYAAAVLVTVIVSAVTFRGLPEWLNTYVIGLFSRGAFATALWAVVMWTGAFPNGSKPIKALMPIRGELSIFAAILTLGHNIGYGRTYFVRLFTDAERMSTGQLTASILTIILLAIMIPLTVMSFPQVRKKMNAKLWKKLQRAAYLFYALVYVHVMVLFVPLAKAGRPGYFLSVCVYSAVFLGYAVCRIRKWYLLRKKPETTKRLNAVCIPAFAVLMLVPCILARTGTPHQTATADRAEVQTTEHSSDVIASEEATRPAESVNATTSVETETTKAGTQNITETTMSVTSAATEMTEETIGLETVDDMMEEVEIPGAEPVDENDPQEQIPDPEPQPAPEPQQPEPEPEQPEPVYLYQNGSYTASAYGYDGDVEITVTIENDVITSITGVSYESDTWYYDSAAASVIPQILASQNTQADACSGATYSSNAIMEAVERALSMARK